MSKKLEVEIQKILNSLESTQTPAQGLNYITVGDNFRYNLLNLKKEILNLSSQPCSLEKIVIGSFGAGKTHFLYYLKWLLERDVPQKQCVISKVDLSNLNSPEDFQLLVIQGMQLIGENSGYARVL